MNGIRYYGEEFLMWFRYDFLFWTGTSLFAIFLSALLAGKIVIDMLFAAVIIAAFSVNEFGVLIVASFLFYYWMKVISYKVIKDLFKELFKAVKSNK